MPTRQELELRRVQSESKVDPKLLSEVREERKRIEKASAALLRGRTYEGLQVSIADAQKKLKETRAACDRLLHETNESARLILEQAEADAHKLLERTREDAKRGVGELEAEEKRINGLKREFFADLTAFELRVEAFDKREKSIHARAHEKEKSTQEAVTRLDEARRLHENEKEAFRKEVTQTREALARRARELDAREASLGPLIEKEKQVEKLLQRAADRHRLAVREKQAAEAEVQTARDLRTEAQSDRMAVQREKSEAAEILRKAGEVKALQEREKKEVRSLLDSIELKRAQIEAKLVHKT